MKTSGNPIPLSWIRTNFAGFVLFWICSTAAAQAQPAPCVCPGRTQSNPAEKVPNESKIPRQPPAVLPQSQSRTENAAGVVNINTATEAELIRLPNIGPSRAKAIVSLRQRLGGRFTRIEQIIRVRGIGRKTFRKLVSMLVLEGPTTLGIGSRARPSSK